MPPKRPSRATGVATRERLVVLLLLLLSVSVYWNSVRGPYMIDDRVSVLSNPDVQDDTRTWGDLVRSDYWGMPIHEPRSHKSYRPVTVLTFYWSRLASDLSTFGFHLPNVLLNAAVCVLALRVSLVVMRSFSVREGGETRTAEAANVGAYVAAVLYALHPVHVESVANISGRAELMTAAFGYTAFLAHVHAVRTTGTAQTWLWQAASLGLITLGVLSKETGLVVAVVAAGHDVAYHFIGRAKDLPPAHMRTACVVRTLLKAALCVAYLVFRKWLVVTNSPSFTVVDNMVPFADTWFSSIATAMYTHVVYLRVLLFPYWLCSDYSYACIEYITSLADARFIPILVAYAGTAAVALLALRDAFVLRDRRLFMAFAFFICPFLPATHIFKIGTTVAERLMYMPSLGVAMAVGILVSTVWDATRSAAVRRGMLGAVAVVACLFYVRTYNRSNLWNMSTSLMRADIDVCPRSARLLASIGVEHHSKEEWEIARDYYLRSLEVAPKHGHAHHMLGLVYKGAGWNVTTAAYHFEQAMIANPYDASIQKAFGWSLAVHGRTADAVPYFEKAVELNKTDTEAIMNLGAVYGMAKLTDKAAETLEHAAQLLIKQSRRANARLTASDCSTLGEIYSNLVIVFNGSGDKVRAQRAAERRDHYKAGGDAEPRYAGPL